MDMITAFFVEVGLDGKKFEEGAKAALAEVDRLQETVLDSARKMEQGVRKAVGESFRTVSRHFLTFFAALAGAETLRDFILQATRAETQLSIMASVLGTSVPNISAFEMAVQRVGGTLAGADASLNVLNRIAMATNLEGQPADNAFYRLGGTSIDPRADRVTQMVQFADAIAKTNYTEQQKLYLLGRLGIDAATARLLTDPGVLRGLLGSTRADAVTDAQAQSGMKLTGAWAGVTQAIQSFLREVLASAQGPMAELLKNLTDWVEANKSWAAGWLGEKARELKDWVDGIKWDEVKRAAGEVVGVVRSIVDAVGGWRHAAEGVVAAWLLLKAAPIVAAGVGIAAMASPLTTVLAGLTAVLAAFKMYEGTPAHAATLAAGGQRASGHSGVAPSGPRAATQAPASAYTPTWLDPGTPTQAIGHGGTLQTNEGKVGEAHPLPVKVAALPDGSDTFWGYLGKAFGSLGDWLVRNGPAGYFDARGVFHREGGSFSLLSGMPTLRARALGGAPTEAEKTLAQRGYDYLIGQGLNRDQALAVLGNARGENPLGALTPGDHGTAFGQFQWHSDRVADIYRHTGIDVRTASFDDQMRAFRWEAEHGAGGGHIWRALLNAKSREEAVWILVHGFERSGDQQGDFRTRSGYAARYGNFIHGTAPLAAPVTTPAHPAADKTAGDAHVSMLTQERVYHVARVDVHTRSGSSRDAAREVREHLERELASFAVA